MTEAVAAITQKIINDFIADLKLLQKAYEGFISELEQFDATKEDAAEIFEIKVRRFHDHILKDYT